MKRKGWLVVGGTFLSMVAVWLITFRPALEFADMNEAYGSLKKLNYTCRSDVFDGRYDEGFMVSKEEATWVEAASLCKAGPMGPDWKNKVWVVPLPPDLTRRTIPDDAVTRIWGRVFVYGDGAFLDEIERGLQAQRGLVM